jgi:hypothetical protein
LGWGSVFIVQEGAIIYISYKNYSGSRSSRAKISFDPKNPTILAVTEKRGKDRHFLIFAASKY